jgi:hypothetical protein
MTDQLAETSLSEIEKIRAERRAKLAGKSGASAARRGAETASMKAQDGRVRMAASDSGLVQLNVRVTPDLKNQVIHLARTTGSDMNTVVVAALKRHLQNT